MKSIKSLVTASALLVAGVSQAASTAHEESAVATVTRLYQDFAWEVVFDQPDATQDFLSQTDRVWRRYLSPGLTRLLRQDRDCAEHTQEICGLDFDPLWASQDPAATRLQVKPGDRPDDVKVSFLYPGNEQRIDLTFSLVEENGRWLIDDIRYPEDVSLRNVLHQPD